jgi:hypoxanthine phosphoribosyltransferase
MKPVSTKFYSVRVRTVPKIVPRPARRRPGFQRLQSLRCRVHLCPVITKSEEKLKVLLRRSAIERRVQQMGRRITRDFRGQRVHLVGVLKGACYFLADLSRQIDLEVSLDFIAVASYGRGKQSSGQVRLLKDLDSSVQGMNIILVEDILDTGFTLNYLLRLLRQRKPRTLRIAALLDKPERRIKPVKARYVGFKIPNEFVVGYGLDYAERYRNLKDICILSLPTE